MISTNRKAAAIAAAGAAAAVLGLGVSQVARADDGSSTPTPTASAAATQGGTSQGDAPGWGPGGRHGHGSLRGPGDADLSALASTLGVTEAKLEDAMKAVRAELRAARANGQGSATKPNHAAVRDQVATMLASRLGIDAAKVKNALAQLQAAHRAEVQKAFDDRLAQAVKDGKLTQAQADAVKQAAKAGVIGMRGGRP